MASTEKPVVTKEEIKNANSLWNGFTSLMKWSIISVIVVLTLMAIFLTP